MSCVFWSAEALVFLRDVLLGAHRPSDMSAMRRRCKLGASHAGPPSIVPPSPPPLENKHKLSEVRADFSDRRWTPWRRG
eukprot:4650441-Pyramimonas_sp.AAC.1